MMPQMKRTLLPKAKFLFPLCKWVAIVMLALAPATARAAEDEEEGVYDARHEGYANSVTLPIKTSGGTWFLFVILMVIGAGGLFKDARRSHLD